MRRTKTSAKRRKIARPKRNAKRRSAPAASAPRAARTSGGIGERLTRYAASVLNPFDISGVRVPDLTEYPTATEHIVQEWITSNSAGGDAIELCFQPALTPGSGVITAPYRSRVNTAAGAAFPAYLAGNCETWSDYTALAAKYSAWRCVSAGVKVEYVGASLSDSGTCAGTVIDPFDTYCNTGAVEAVTTMPTKYLSNRTSIRQGLEVLWAPLDNTDLEYRSTATPCYSATADFHGAYAEIPTMIVGIYGLTAGQSVRVRVAINWELIPKRNSSGGITAKTEPYNPKALNQVKGIFSQIGAFVHPLADAAGQFLSSRKHPVLQGIGGALNMVSDFFSS